MKKSDIEDLLDQETIDESDDNTRYSGLSEQEVREYGMYILSENN